MRNENTNNQPLNSEVEVLAYYESIVEASEQMLHAAEQSDWDALVAAERECAACIERLKAARLPQSLGAEADKRRFDLIRLVLDRDAKIRALTQPRLHQLERMLGAGDAQRRVDQAYR